jgi:hypothetical protein
MSVMKQQLNDVLALKATSQSKSWRQHIGTLFPILLVCRGRHHVGACWVLGLSA